MGKAPEIVEPEAPDAAFAGEVVDIDPDQWLAENDTQVTGRVKLRSGKYVTIAALTDDEVKACRKVANRLDPARGRGAYQFDEFTFRQALVAKSFSKVTQKAYLPEMLSGKLSGDVVNIADAITKLSGFDPNVPENERLLGFSA